MKMQKKFFNILLLFAIAAPQLSASRCDYATPSAVVTENPAYTVDFGFRGLALKPHVSNLHYAAEAFPLPAPSPHWNIYDIRPHYHFGFDITFNAFFHKLNTNLYANWEHFRGSDCAAISAATENMVGPFFEIGPDALPYANASGRVAFKFNEFNISYGQNVNFGNRLHTNFFAGVSFAHIEECLSATYSNEDGTIARTITTPISFAGAGPQVGVDFMYDIVCGLQFAGRATGSLLTGKLKNHTAYESISPALTPLGITPPNAQSTSLCSRTQIVPAFNQRLGIAYAFEFCDHYLVRIEAGYQAQIYLSALQSVDMGSEVVTPPVAPDTVGVFARTFQRNISNFGLTGPYATIEVGF